jgi:hypothetical protein
MHLAWSSGSALEVSVDEVRKNEHRCAVGRCVASCDALTFRVICCPAELWNGGVGVGDGDTDS